MHVMEAKSLPGALIRKLNQSEFHWIRIINNKLQ